MTVGTLIEMLQDEDENAEIRIMHQPGYPLVHMVDGIVTQTEIDQDRAMEAAEDGEEAEIDEDSANILYFVASEGSPRPNPYGDKRAWPLCRDN